MTSPDAQQPDAALSPLRGPEARDCSIDGLREAEAAWLDPPAAKDEARRCVDAVGEFEFAEPFQDDVDCWMLALQLRVRIG